MFFHAALRIVLYGEEQCILPCPAEGRHGLTVCKKTFILIAVRQVLQKLFAVSDYPYPEGKEMKP